MASSNFSFIRTWNASLFDNVSHKWKYGQLNLSASAIVFNEREGQGKNEKSNSLCIDFYNISSINKALSSYVFPAITVITDGGNTFWFSSFQNRNSTFITLQHFFQASLHQKPAHLRSSTVLPPSDKTRTKFGTELLQSIQDSQTTLKKAAVNMVQQGDQLRTAALTMEELHEDLVVAERISGGLDSWLGRWKLPPTKKAEELILVTSNDIPDVLDIEVLYSQVTETNIGIQSVGVLRVAKDGITILDLKQKVVQYFKWSDVSRIRVVSPWEILVTRFLIGQSDLSYDVISMTMPKVLRKLCTFASRKLEFMNAPDKHQIHQLGSLADSRLDRPSQTVSPSDSNGEITPTFSCPKSRISTGSDLQQQTQKDVILDSEVSELSAALCDLKNLALDIQIEQDSQTEIIDNLTMSVTRGNDKIRAMNSKIDKLGK